MEMGKRFVTITFICWVKSQPYIELHVITDIQFQLDNLSLACLPVNEATSASISDIILWKNSTFGWETLIKVFSDISQGNISQRIVWFNTDIANRSVVTLATVAPSITAGLTVEIPAENVEYDDNGTYRCSIDGNLPNTSAKLHDFSVSKYVRIIEENLSLACLPVNVATKASISDIILWKNATSGWERLVKIVRDISEGHVVQKIVWFSIDVGNRSVVTLARVTPSITAGLKIEIPAENVEYGDNGTYRCSIDGKFQHTSFTLHGFSLPKFVRINIDYQNVSSGDKETNFLSSKLALFLVSGFVCLVISLSILVACCLCNRQHKEMDNMSMEKDCNHPKQCSYIVPSETNLCDNIQCYTELHTKQSNTKSRLSAESNQYEDLKVYGNSSFADDNVDEQIYMNV